VRFLAEKLLHLLLDARHPGHPPHQNDFVNGAPAQAGIPQGLLHWGSQTVDESLHQRLQLGPRQLDVHMFGAGGVSRDERQVDFRFHGGGEFDFGLLRSLLQPLQRHFVTAQVDPIVLLELARKPVDHPLVKIFPSQVGIAVG